MWRFVFFYCALNNIKVNGGRKVTCAVHGANWVYFENILSAEFFFATGAVSRLFGELGRKDKIIL